MRRRTRSRYWRAVWGYRLRVVFRRPYRNGIDREELRRRYGV